MATFAIIGLGKMGKYYDQAVHADYVVDIYPADHKNYFGSVDKFLDARPKVDLVIVSTPSNTHFDISSALLKCQYNLLVEKPVCLTVKEAETLENLARIQNCILYQSTLERYNPVVKFFKANIDLKKVFSIHSYRIGPRPNRSFVEDVAFDLGIHEVDLYLYLNYAKVPWQITVGYQNRQQREIVAIQPNGSELRFDLLNQRIKGPEFEHDFKTNGLNNPMIDMIGEILSKGTKINEVWSKEIRLLQSFKTAGLDISYLNL